MRVLVTGASGVFGRDVVRRLAIEGHEVVGLSRSLPRRMPAGVSEYRTADVQDPAAVSNAVAGMDAVVHLAWTLYPLKDLERTRGVDLGGTRNVLDAMARHDVKRLVFASSVMSYGAHPDNPARLTETDPQRPHENSPYALHKLEAERLIVDSGLDALMIRAGSVVGRGVDGITEEQFASPFLPGVRGHTSRMQFLHPEDVGRFFAEAVAAPWSGAVNLASPDSITMPEIAEILGVRYAELPRKALERAASLLWKTGLANLDPGSFRALLWFPIVDTTKLESLGFRCGWTSRECVEDFARSAAGKTFVLGRRLPSSLPFGYSGNAAPAGPVRDDMRPAGPEGLNGEFDSLVDPDLPAYTSANTSEAYPGPMSPLSLELGMDSLRTSGARAAEVLGFPSEVQKLLSERQVGSFGHGIYANLSVILAMAKAMPGGESSGWESLFGDSHVSAPDVHLTLRDKARVGARTVRVLRGYSKDASRVDLQSRAIFRSADALAPLTDEALMARITLARDAVLDAMTVAANGAAFVASVASALEQRGLAGLITSRAGNEDLASAGALRAVYEIASELRRDPALREAVHSASLAGPKVLEILDVEQPTFAKQVRQLLAEYGHRGPRELELTSAVYADAPQRFLDIAVKAAQQPERHDVGIPPQPPRHLRAVAVWGHRLHQARETARDAHVRATHAFRLAVRERGRRLAKAGVLDTSEDAFYLTLAEVLRTPSDARVIVTRRRAERQRLEGLRLPAQFSMSWQPEEGPGRLRVGGSLGGVAVSPGKVSGVARLLDPSTLDDLEPGEILVAAYTDAGWTPLFGVAGAVVTDTGGPMSHAAVVAREFAIPCVVGVSGASQRLVSGQTIEVDANNGRVTVLADVEEDGQ